jgi:hypothetical protein
MQNIAKKITPKNPKGAGRPALPKKEKKLRRKESIHAYKSSKKEFKCMIDPILHNELKTLKNKLNMSYEEMLLYMLEKSKN